MNPFPSPARPGVSIYEVQRLNSPVPLNVEAIHEYPHVGEGGHESLGPRGYGTTPNSRRPTVDPEPAVTLSQPSPVSRTQPHG